MDAKKEFIKALGRADMDLLSMQNTIGNLEAWRDGADTWGDVGTMKHIAEQIAEIKKELEQYGKTRLLDDEQEEQKA